MKQKKILNRKLLEEMRQSVSGKTNLPLPETLDYPEKIVQFGGGNFLRAFVDWMVQIANNSGTFKGRVVVVQSTTSKRLHWLNEQDGLSTLLVRGIKDENIFTEQYVIGSISRALSAFDWSEVIKVASQPSLKIIISNTTEAGIVYDPSDDLMANPPSSFPAKLVSFLYARFNVFNGEPEKGFIIIPLELIKNNGDRLKEIVLKLITEKGLPEEFLTWVEKHNLFCNTLVDRIVSGKPDEQELLDLGYEDRLLNSAEPYYLWVIQGDERVRKALPFDLIGLNVLFVPDVNFYRERKVRILNASHTALLPLAYLSGFNYVQESVEEPLLGCFGERIVKDEIIPVLSGERADLETYADTIRERFRNPFIKHRWLDISLNSVSKVRARILPTINDFFEKKGFIPPLTTFAFAAFLCFYRPVYKHNGKFFAQRDKESYSLTDDPGVLEILYNIWHSNLGTGLKLKKILSQEKLWESNLDDIPYFSERVAEYLRLIEKLGVYKALAFILNENLS